MRTGSKFQTLAALWWMLSAAIEEKSISFLWIEAPLALHCSDDICSLHNYLLISPIKSLDYFGIISVCVCSCCLCGGGCIRDGGVVYVEAVILQYP